MEECRRRCRGCDGKDKLPLKNYAHCHSFDALLHSIIRAECPPYGQVPAYRKPVSRYLASFELSAQVATEAGCYNDGRV